MTRTTTSAPLAAPLYNAGFTDALARFFKKYATFTGRASRSEFWLAYLGVAAVNIVLYAIMMVAFGASTTITPYGEVIPGMAGMIVLPFLVIWALGVLVPVLAVIWRRLHDTNRSGAFFFLVAIPVVGGIILLVLLALPSDPGGARFDA